MDTAKSLAQEIVEGNLTLEAAAEMAAKLEFPIEKRDEEGVYYDGEQDNTYSAVYAVLGERTNGFFLLIEDFTD